MPLTSRLREKKDCSCHSWQRLCCEGSGGTREWEGAHPTDWRYLLSLPRQIHNKQSLRGVGCVNYTRPFPRCFPPQFSCGMSGLGRPPPPSGLAIKVMDRNQLREEEREREWRRGLSEHGSLAEREHRSTQACYGIYSPSIAG